MEARIQPDPFAPDDEAEGEVLMCVFGGNERSPIVDGSLAEITVDLASLLQDDVIDELREAWPTCPGHPHPMEARITDHDVAVWRCPADPMVGTPIGGLAARQ